MWLFRPFICWERTMITDVYKKRVQTFIFNNDVPEKELINSLLEKTYELVPSKQNIIPYKVVVWGPEYDKEEFRNFCRYGSDMRFDYKNGTVQLLAPYVLFFCLRDINDANEKIKKMVRMGRAYDILEKGKNLETTHIEIGMFASILTGLCLENNLSVSYTLCKPSAKDKGWKDFNFLSDRVLFMLSIGNSSQKKSLCDYNENKPPLKNIVEWI